MQNPYFYVSGLIYKIEKKKLQLRLRKLEFWEGIRQSVLEKFEEVMKLVSF